MLVAIFKFPHWQMDREVEIKGIIKDRSKRVKLEFSDMSQINNKLTMFYLCQF